MKMARPIADTYPDSFNNLMKGQKAHRTSEIRSSEVWSSFNMI